jgi:hypothetical protein
MDELIAYAQQTPSKIKELPPVEAFDWMPLIWVSYSLIAFVLVTKIVLNLLSLYRMLYKQQTYKREGFTLVNLERNIAPFSFFNYIVYNSDLYSDTELRSIILHEQIHSKEYHSIDVLLVQLFSAIFWFNPFIWFYKKAITQNLEYIADQKAIEQMEDRHAYQHALLKVVSNHNCLSITNHFYQSLIKKRIVMLNTNPSRKRNSWKYALIIPVLIGFIFLFQIKVIAQEKGTYLNKEKYPNITHDGADITLEAKETDKYLKTLKNVFSEEKITTDVSKIKRNSVGEITGICIKMKCEDGRKKELRINQSTPIDKIFIYTNKMENGSYDFGVKHVTTDEIRALRKKNDQKRQRVYIFKNGEDTLALAFDDSIPKLKDFNFDFTMEAPEVPEPPLAPEVAEVPESPKSLAPNDKQNSNIIIRRNGGKKPLVIINGKVLSDDQEIKEALEKYEAKGKGLGLSSDEENEQIIINGQDMMKIRSEALADADIQIKRMRPQMEKQMEIVRKEKNRVKAEMDKARAEMEASKPEMEKAKAEMIQAKEEMLKAKAEMVKAKTELDNERAKLKKAK